MTAALCPVVVGRDEEQRALRAALASAARGAGGAMVVTGEAGIGKSRLVHELADDARRRGIPVAVGRAVPTGRTEPYRPLTEALLQLLRDRPLPEDDGLRPWLPALGTIVPTARATVAGAARRGGDTTPVRGEAVMQLLARLAGEGAVLAVLEDLQWADTDTLALVEYLLDNASAAPVLWVATSRSDEPCPALDLARRLHARRRAEHLALARLDDDQVATMARACAPSASDDDVRGVHARAEGVPLLVEELLATPGVPATVSDAVRSRLAALSDSARMVVDAAAVLGRHFDWRLLPPATGLSADEVSRGLERAVDALLLAVDGARFRFRHALTREAIVADLLPPRRAALAAAALAAVDAADHRLDPSGRDLATDLAIQAGDHDRAGALLAESGLASCERGALSTGIDALRHALELLGDTPGRATTASALVDALALAGRVDEAMEHGRHLLVRLADGDAPAAEQAAVHIRLAHAAVDATRWHEARVQLDAATGLLAARPHRGLGAHVDVLRAEVALAADDIDVARRHADAVVASPAASPEVRCHALELVGRSERVRDLDVARRAFEQALTTAEAADLPIWRLRALHELGTIELFEHGTAERLQDARRTAAELGALSTGAVLDVQLVAAAGLRFALDDMIVHATEAVAVTERLGLGRLHATALNFLAEAHGLRRQRDDMERHLARAAAAAPGDAEIEGIAWACRGLLALLEDDRPGATDALGRAVAIVRELPQAPPGTFRGLWPVLLAASGDRRAQDAIAEVRGSVAGATCWNRGLTSYAEAIVAGAAGDGGRASDLARAADTDLAHAPVWCALARLHAAERAVADGWGDPMGWVEAARSTFATFELGALAARCDAVGAVGVWPPARFGITTREADVLELVVDGLANKEIAAALGVSARTVEKHVESLLRKTGARSRTHLVAVTGRAGASPT